MFDFRSLKTECNSWIFKGFRLLLWFVAGGLAAGCNDLLFVTNNLAETWENPKWQGPQHVCVTALNADSVTVYLEVEPSRLPAIRGMEGDVYRKGTYSLGIFSDFSKKGLVDTTSLHLYYPIHSDEKVSIVQAAMRAPSGRDYLLWIKPEGQPAAFYPVYRATFQADAEWLLKDENDEPIVKAVDLLSKPFYIHLNANQGKHVIVRRYQMNSCLPLPPFVESSRRCAHTLVTVGVLSFYENKAGPVMLPGGGIYLLQADTSSAGARMVSLNDEKSLQWITRLALRYITTPEEWSELEQGRMDPWDFWESVAGSTQRAVQLSSAFKIAVNRACRLFSEEVPGALTDRGMIYLVFGPPAMVVTSGNTETWTYTSSENDVSLTFDFDIHVTPVGISQYHLRRNPMWKQPWMQAVERCRR